MMLVSQASRACTLWGVGAEVLAGGVISAVYARFRFASMSRTGGRGGATEEIAARPDPTQDLGRPEHQRTGVLPPPCLLDLLPVDGRGDERLLGGTQRIRRHHRAAGLVLAPVDQHLAGTIRAPHPVPQPPPVPGPPRHGPP